MSDTKVIHSSDTSGHIFSLFLKYVSANVLGMIGFSCYILADTFFIARGIGSDALAALNLVLPAYSLLNGTGLMIGMGGGSRYSLSSTHPEGETHRTVFTQSVLLKLRDSRLEDDMLLEEFYDKVIATYEYAENYYIILIHAMYDIPGKSSDDMEMFDASDEVYQHILMSICPVSLSKAGLSYNAEENCIQDRIRDWIVDRPDKGFLFPAFNDRSTDLHSVLYYTKKSEDLQPEMIDQLLGAKMPMSADTQKETFQMIIEDTLGEDGDYETVRNIHETLNELIEEHKEDPDPLSLDKTDVKKIFEQSGVSNEKMENFDQNFEENAGEKASLLASNIAETKKFNIETPDVVI